jgi:hypothetical protein
MKVNIHINYCFHTYSTAHVAGQRHTFVQEQDLHSEVTDLKLKLDDLRSIHESVCQEKNLLETHCKELDNEMEETSHVMALLKSSQHAELNKLREKYESSKGNLRTQIESLQARNDELEIEKDILLEGIAELEARLDHYASIEEGSPAQEAEEANTAQTSASPPQSPKSGGKAHGQLSVAVPVSPSAGAGSPLDTLAPPKLSSPSEQEGAYWTELLSSKESIISELNASVAQLQDSLEAQKRLAEELSSSAAREVAVVHEEKLQLQRNYERLQQEQNEERDQLQTSLRESQWEQSNKVNSLEALISELRLSKDNLQRQVEEQNERVVVDNDAGKKNLEIQLLNREQEITALHAKIATLMDVMSRQQSEGEDKLRNLVASLQTENAKLVLELEMQVSESNRRESHLNEQVEQLQESHQSTLRLENTSSQTVQEKLKQEYEEKIFQLTKKSDALEATLHSEREAAESLQTRLRVSAVIEKSEFDKQLADYAGVVNKLVQSREKREQDVLQEKETIRNRYKRNEEVFEKELEEATKKLALQEAEFRAEKESLVARDARREEEFSRSRDEMNQREKRLETEFKRSMDDMRTRKLKREQELQSKITELRDECTVKMQESLDAQDKYKAQEGLLTDKFNAEKTQLLQLVAKLESDLTAQEQEHQLQAKMLRGEGEVPVIHERFGMLNADLENKSFYITELSSTILGLWERAQQVELDHKTKAEQLTISERKVADLSGQVNELETALDTAEFILKESEEVKTRMATTEQSRTSSERQLELSTNQLLYHHHHDYELFEQVSQIQAELDRKLAQVEVEVEHVAILQQKELGSSRALLQQVQQPNAQSKTDTMLESIKARKIQNHVHDYEMSLQDACSVDTMNSDNIMMLTHDNEFAEESKSGTTPSKKGSSLNKDNTASVSTGADRPNAVALFNSSLQFIFGHLQTINYLQSVVGRDLLLQSCGVGSSVPTSRSHSSKRLRAALTKAVFPDVETFNDKDPSAYESASKFPVTADGGRLPALIPVDSVDDDTDEHDYSNHVRAGERVIYPRRPVDPSVGKRSMVVSSPGSASPLASSVASKLPKSPLHNSASGFALHYGNSAHKMNASAENVVDIADVSFMVDMGDTYNSLMERLVGIETETEEKISQHRKKPLPNNHASAGSDEYDPLKEMATKLLQSNYHPRIVTRTVHIGRGGTIELKFDKSLAGSVPPLQAGTGNLDGINVIQVYDRLQNNLKVCTSGMIILKDKLVVELKEMDHVLKSQFHQLETLGNLVIKSRGSGSGSGDGVESQHMLSPLEMSSASIPLTRSHVASSSKPTPGGRQVLSSNENIVGVSVDDLLDVPVKPRSSGKPHGKGLSSGSTTSAGKINSAVKSSSADTKTHSERLIFG